MQTYTSREINVDKEKRSKKENRNVTGQRTRKRPQRKREQERVDTKKEKEGQEEKVPAAHGSEDIPQLTSNHGRALGEPTAPTRPNGPAGPRDQLVQMAQLTGASCPAVLERRRGSVQNILYSNINKSETTMANMNLEYLIFAEIGHCVTNAEKFAN